MPGEHPEPGPPCRTRAGFPSGLPQSSQYRRWPSPTSSAPVSYGSTGGYRGSPSGSGSATSGDVGELGPQVQHRLGVHLADPALGHAEDPADLGQGEPLEVVEADDDLLAVGELLDRAGEQLP